MSFKKGNTINLGRKPSEETRQKMRDSHKGIKPSKWGAGFRKGSVPWNKGTSFDRNAYFAGLFDGEGSVMITANTNMKEKYRSVAVSISMRADKAQPLPEGHKIWGGSLHERQPREHNNNLVLEWRLWTRSAEKFLISIRPFLRIKDRQVDLALEYRKLQTRKRNGTNRISEKELIFRTEIEKKLKALNQ